MRFVLMADTHGQHPVVPDGDVLIHAGDLTLEGRYMEIAREAEWLRNLPHKHKILIAGNHDWLFEKDYALAKIAVGPSITYLQDDQTVLPGGYLVYGAPWTPRFFDWAFNLDRGEPLRHKWKMMPDKIDILVTHGPPLGILDEAKRHYERRGPLNPDGKPQAATEHAGCADLRERVAQIKPLLHVFGHIHPPHGHVRDGKTLFVNAAIGYHNEHKPIVVDIEGNNAVVVNPPLV